MISITFDLTQDLMIFYLCALATFGVLLKVYQLFGITKNRKIFKELVSLFIMTNETIHVVKIGDPIDFNVSNNVAITKGAILKLTTPRTAILAAGKGDLIAGIAARDKIASDGRTKLAVWRQSGNIFRMLASGSISAGDAVITSAGPTNSVMAQDASAAGCKIIGFALEGISDGAYGEIELNIQQDIDTA